MRNFILTLLLAITSMSIQAQENSGDFDYILLNNGNLVKGFIIKENPADASITIKSVNGQEHTYYQTDIRRINRMKSPAIPSKGNDKDEYKNYSEFKTGFWGAAEANFGYSCNIDESNSPYAGLNVVGGYRFNDYLKVGLGVGGRYYINNMNIRSNKIRWSFPIFANVRGNIISSLYRSIVPYYSFEIGGAIRDGFFFSPTIGVRFGEPRSAFLVGVAYTGQSLNGWEDRTIYDIPVTLKERKFMSFVSLKLGYEF